MKARTFLALAIALPLLAGCSALDHGFLNAQGPVADHERHLFGVVVAILSFVWIPIVILVPAFAWHYRLSNTTDAYRPKWAFSWPLEGFIWLPPFAIVIVLAIILWPATKRDDPYTRLAERGALIRIQAIALDWKWVFIYPDQHVATVNQLAIPAGRPVQLQLTSGTVMQSLLLPQLAGQIYTMAGMRTKLNFEAYRPGRYMGENVQFNGDKFADQKFAIVSMTPAAYRTWLAEAASVKRPLNASAWASLSKRDLVYPTTFSSVPDNFFDWVVSKDGGEAHVHLKHSEAM